MQKKKRIARIRVAQSINGANKKALSFSNLSLVVNRCSNTLKQRVSHLPYGMVNGTNILSRTLSAADINNAFLCLGASQHAFPDRVPASGAESTEAPKVAPKPAGGPPTSAAQGGAGGDHPPPTAAFLPPGAHCKRVHFKRQLLKGICLSGACLLARRTEAGPLPSPAGVPAACSQKVRQTRKEARRKLPVFWLKNIQCGRWDIFTIVCD